MGTIYGYWTCDYCGAENRGDKYQCTGCGKNRGKDVKFYITPKQINEPQQKAAKSHGPDWHCPYCDSLNSAAQAKCGMCGHAREDSSKDYFNLHPEEAGFRPVGQDFANSQATQRTIPSTDAASRHHDDNLVLTTSENPYQSHDIVEHYSPRPTIFSILGIIALLVIIAVIFFPYHTEATILDKSWECRVIVEEYRTFHESDWFVPIGGRETGHHLAIHHYEQVLDHYETVTNSREVPDGGHEEVVGYTNNGDGTFDEVTTYVTDYRTEYYTEQEPVYRDEPVYQTKYEYDIERWTFDHCEVTSGHFDAPYFASPKLDARHRTNGTMEKYEISISCTNRRGKLITTSLATTLTEWETLEKGETIPVDIYAGSIVSLALTK